MVVLLYLYFIGCTGKMKTTGDIYKHKMQVNNDPLKQGSSTPPVAETMSDDSTADVPAMPSMDHTMDTSLDQQQQQHGEGEQEREQEDREAREREGEEGEEEEEEGEEQGEVGTTQAEEQ